LKKQEVRVPTARALAQEGNLHTSNEHQFVPETRISCEEHVWGSSLQAVKSLRVPEMPAFSFEGGPTSQSQLYQGENVVCVIFSGA
jgi:hypothetical protein